MQRGKSGKVKTLEGELLEGSCATCGTLVKWPRGVREYRCSTCLMVNDLQPLRLRPPTRPTEAAAPTVSRSGTNSGSVYNARPPPLNVERTKAILKRSMSTFFESLLSRLSSTHTSQISQASLLDNTLDQNASRLVHTSPYPASYSSPRDHFSPLSRSPPAMLSPPNTSRRPSYSNHVDSRPRPEATNSLANSSIRRKPIPAPNTALPERPLRNPNVPSLVKSPTFVDMITDRQHVPQRSMSSGPNDIDGSYGPPSPFKPLEDYIIRSFGEHECINCSFLRARPPAAPALRSDEDVISRRLAASPAARSPMPEPTISELDPKLLLLGNVAENSSWWTGHEEQSPELELRSTQRAQRSSQPPLVHSKSPCINWREAHDWYGVILNAGLDWRERLQDFKAASSIVSDGREQIDASLEQIDATISEGRLRLHRVLLKATENLLKRPGRPLTESQDVRFLMILLANPLLYAQTESHKPREISANPTSNPRSRSFNGLSRPMPSNTSAVISIGPRDRDQVYAVIKRIFGLLSNASSEVHRHLTAWLARYDEERLSELVELVQQFVTRRLRRQHGRHKSNPDDDLTADLIPNLSGTHADTSAQLHAALGLGSQNKGRLENRSHLPSYMEDWQVKAAAKVMALLFSANKNFHGERSTKSLAADARMSRPGSLSRTYIKNYGQSLSTSDFYNSMVDMHDLVLDFEAWESTPNRFSFCQYPFFLSVGSKIRIMEHDAKRQMEVRAREAFFDNLLKNKSIEQYLLLKVRRDCLVEDSLKTISETVGAGQQDIKKELKIQFVNEEGIDAGGLRKEWFLLLTREIFDPRQGMFLYDDQSQFCYFNPYSFETSDQYFLVGALLGLAIYNSTILDVALPPFTFKKLLASGPPHATQGRTGYRYTLKDLAEYKPELARGLGQLLEYNGDVQATFCRDFVIEVERYGQVVAVALCDNGARRPVTNSNRAEFVDLYIRYLLDIQVARQYEPFKRGFFTVCGGNALSLFQPEEIELLVRGSDEPLDVSSLKAVAVYENWHQESTNKNARVTDPAEQIPLLQWFWTSFEQASPTDQRKLLGFITGSDRIPAVGAANLVIKLAFGGPDANRFPVARTCFNQLLLYEYRSRAELENKLWTAVGGSEGFGLK